MCTKRFRQFREFLLSRRKMRGDSSSLKQGQKNGGKKMNSGWKTHLCYMTASRLIFFLIVYIFSFAHAVRAKDIVFKICQQSKNKKPCVVYSTDLTRILLVVYFSWNTSALPFNALMNGKTRMFLSWIMGYSMDETCGIVLSPYRWKV